MNNQTKIYIGVGLAALTIAAFISSSIWTTRKFSRLENELHEAKQAARSADKLAAQRENEAAEYKQKIAYLEIKLTENQTTARKQDETLETLTNNTRNARRRRDAARRPTTDQ